MKALAGNAELGTRRRASLPALRYVTVADAVAVLAIVAITAYAGLKIALLY